MLLTAGGAAARWPPTSQPQGEGGERAAVGSEVMDEDTLPFVQPEKKQLVHFPLEFASMVLWCDALRNNILAEVWHSLRDLKSRPRPVGNGFATGGELIVKAPLDERLTQHLVTLGDCSLRFVASPRPSGTEGATTALRLSGNQDLQQLLLMGDRSTSASSRQWRQVQEACSPGPQLASPRAGVVAVHNTTGEGLGEKPSLEKVQPGPADEVAGVTVTEEDLVEFLTYMQSGPVEAPTAPESPKSPGSPGVPWPTWAEVAPGKKQELCSGLMEMD